MSEFDDIEDQEERQREADRLRALRTEKLRDAYCWLMADKRGRLLMWSWLEMCRVFALSFSESAGEMAFREGNRNVGLTLMNGVLDACPEQWAVMSSEFRNGGEVPA